MKNQGLENIGTFKLKQAVTVLDKLFLVGDTIYIQAYDGTNGRWQNVFDVNKNLLGKISSDLYFDLKKKMERL